MLVPLDVLYEGEGTAARWCLQAHPALGPGPGALTQAHVLPCGDITL